LTRYGVPDDEMPDSPLPPWWGPAPFDERDLDAVLSGETADVPVALRPVADALAALQAAPMPSELRGQAMIMAEFRALAEFRAAGLGKDGRIGDTRPTLVLSVPREGPARRRAPRHRARRRAAPVASRRAGALIGAAATAIVLAAVVLAGNVSGPFHRVGSSSASTPSAARNAGENSSSPKVEGSASQEPTARPTAGGSPTTQQSKGSRLCHAVYDIVKDSGSSARGKQEMSSLSSLLRQLSKLAGGSRQLPGYCAQFLGDLFPDGTLPHIPGLGGEGTGSSQAGQDNQGALAHL
jgi:hypothetical protein